LDITRAEGGSAVAALASPSSTVEELYLLQKLMGSIGSGNVDFRPRHSDFSADSNRAGTPWLGMPIAEIENQDAILVVGSFLRKDHPLIAQRIRQAAKKYTQVSMVSVTSDDQLIKLHAQVTVSPSALASSLAEIVKAATQNLGLPLPLGCPDVVVSEASLRIAQSLIKGEKSAILLGNVAEHSENASQIRLLSQTLAQLVHGSIGVLGDGANSVGGYLAGALPTESNARQMFENPKQAYILLGLEAESDVHNPQIALAALGMAKIVVHIGSFASETVKKYADVLLPASPFTETSGTYVNIEGRVQSFNGVVKPLGDSRPGWKILRVLGNLLGAEGFDYTSTEEIRDLVLGSGSAFAGGLDSGLNGVSLNVQINDVPTLQRIADVPIYSSDALVRRAMALQATRDARTPTARMSSGSLESLGLSSGDKVKVIQGGGIAELVAELDPTVPLNCVLVSAAHVSTVNLGSMFGPISVERA
jgi:NADH-quinone oxidoreductase subunit G